MTSCSPLAFLKTVKMTAGEGRVLRARMDSATVRYRTGLPQETGSCTAETPRRHRLPAQSVADRCYPARRVSEGMTTSSTRVSTVWRVGGRLAMMDRKMR